MILRVPAMAIHFRRHFSSFAPRCETTILLFYLPELGKPFKIRHLSEKEDMELADALLENTSVTYLELETKKYTKIYGEAMAEYIRTSNHLQRIYWPRRFTTYGREMWHHEEMWYCFLFAFQESTSLKELQIDLPLIGGPSNLALENMLAHTQSLRSLSLICPTEDIDVAAVSSGLKKEHHSTRAHTGISAGCNECLPHFYQSTRPSSPSKAMFAGVYGGSEWTRDCVVKRRLQNQGT
jgi:hypothetical protein